MAATKALLADKRDMWGRPYEERRFQWLPAEVSVSEEGTCTFESYINNLPRDKFPVLYTALGELLSLCLPHFEAVYGHGSAVEFIDEDGDSGDSDIEDEDVVEKSLRGRRLQVVTKIVDYELAPGQSHEGVWHVEGMSHENIVATAELVLRKDAALEGGDLSFKRAFLQKEAGSMTMSFPQCRPGVVDDFVKKGLCPLGKVPLDLGQITAWSNSHVHKLSPLRNAGDSPGLRRIVVCWLVNPERRIVSSAMVPPQQKDVPLEKAKELRMELMEERKRHKQDWNV